MLIIQDVDEDEEEEERALKAALLVLKVPNVSISMTVLNPLDVNSSAGARKLPAAQLTRM
jgi:hypothetical protein